MIQAGDDKCVAFTDECQRLNELRSVGTFGAAGFVDEDARRTRGGPADNLCRFVAGQLCLALRSEPDHIGFD